MEPGSEDPGYSKPCSNTTPISGARFNGAGVRRPRIHPVAGSLEVDEGALQWSRGPKTPDTSCMRTTPRSGTLLQWSRGPKTPDTPPHFRSKCVLSRLQWSRGPKTPDTGVRMLFAFVLGGASMEPGSEDPGYYSSSKNWPTGQRRFNGAGVRRPRIRLLRIR